jgi:hypothetical protein
MRYAQVRLSISSSLRTNDALFGCTSWNGYAYVPSKWVVQSPGVTNNNKLVHHTLMYNTYNHLLFILLCTRASFVFVHRIMATAVRINTSENFRKKPGEHFPRTCAALNEQNANHNIRGEHAENLLSFRY